MFDTEKLEWCRYPMVKKMKIRLLVFERDDRTERHKDTDIYSRYFEKKYIDIDIWKFATLQRGAESSPVRYFANNSSTA